VDGSHVEVVENATAFGFGTGHSSIPVPGEKSDLRIEADLMGDT
jgi:hypothetical protein